MGKEWTYNSGDWLAICDSCGRKFKASQIKKRWDGLMVCSDDWEPRHSLDFVRSRADKQTPPWIRTQAPLIFNHVLGVYESLPVNEVFSRVANFYRTEADSITVADTLVDILRRLDIAEDIVLTEHQTKTVAIFLQDAFKFVDGNYFYEDYLAVNDDYILPNVELARGLTLSELLTIVEQVYQGEVEGISESTTLSEFGVISLPLYIDATYFSSDYMKTTQPFL